LATGCQARILPRNSQWVHTLWIAPLLLLSAPTLAFLWDKLTHSIWNNGHGIFVPLLVVGLAYHALRSEPVKSEEPSAWGFAFLIPALGLVAIDSAIRTELLSAFALLLCLPGLSLLLLGRRRTRALAFPFFLSFLMLPIPSAFLTRIHLALRELAAAGGEEALYLLGVPALAQGSYLHLPHGTFEIIEECSGFSAVYAAFTIALILAYLSHSWRRRVLLLLIPVPLALAVNVLRVLILALLAETQGYTILDTPLHLLSGYATFILTLALVFTCAERHKERDPS
jgi:exosortase